jgi:hypothetical protein
VPLLSRALKKQRGLKCITPQFSFTTIKHFVLSLSGYYKNQESGQFWQNILFTETQRKYTGYVFRHFPKIIINKTDSEFFNID